MKHKRGKITEATERELYAWWFDKGYDDIYSFPDYLERMKDLGVKVVEKEKI